MKPHRLLFVSRSIASHLCQGSLLSTLFFTATASAIDQTWIDTNSNNNWDLTTTNWDTSSLWTQNNNAIFGGTGETVTLTTGISANALTFNSNGYTIAGNTLTLTGSQSVVVNTGVSTTFTTSIAGNTLNKSGDGTMILNGANTLSTVNVSAGTLKLAGNQVNNRLSANATVTVSSGATLDFINTNPTPGGASAVSIILNGGTLTSTGGDHSHINNVTLNGATWTTGSGSSTYDNERWYLVGDVTTIGSTNSTISGNGIGLAGVRTFSVDANRTLAVTANLNNGSNTTGSLIKAGAGTMTLGSSDYSGSTTVNGGSLIISGTMRNTFGMTANSGAILELGSTNMFVGGHGDTVSNSRILTANGGQIIFNTSMESRIGNITLSNGGILTSNRSLNGWDVVLGNTTTGAATISVTGTGAAAMTGLGGIHLKDIQNFDVANVSGDAGNDLNVSMTLADAGSLGGTGGINKLGDGTMSLTRQATYTGGTTITAGTLSLDTNGDGAGLIRGTVTIKPGATLRLNANDVTGYGTGTDRVSTINIEGGTMHTSTTQNQTLGSTVINMTGGAITGIANSNLDFFAGGSALNTLASATTSTISGTKVNLRQTSVTFNIADGAAATDLEISSYIYGNSLVKNGAGHMRLTADNAYSGTTTINGGTLTMHDSVGVSSYDGGQISINNGSNLTVSGSRYDFGNLTFAFGATGGNSITTGSNVNWVAQGNWTFDSTGGARNTIGGATGINLNNGGRSVTFNVTRGTDATSDLNVTQGIGNTNGGLTKNGNGILTLGGSNTYTGATTISAGTLLLTGSLGNSAVSVAAGASLVNNGTINGTVSSAASATISGTGTFTSAVTISGQLNPGNSPGFQTYHSDLTLTNTTQTTFELGGTSRSTLTSTGDSYYDALDVTGLLTLDGAIQVISYNGFSAQLGDSFDLFNAGSINASGFNLATDLSLPTLTNGLSWDTSNFLSNGVLTVIPEPSSLALLALSSLTIGLRRRR